MDMSSVMKLALLVTLSQAAPPLTWKVTDSDVTFEMTAKDLRALREGKEVFGLQSRKKAFLAKVKPDAEDRKNRDTSDWSASESYKVLSVVGPWVSYERSSAGYSGGAHPYEHTDYVATDVTRDPDSVSLLAVFPEREVLAALKADGFVKKHISDATAFKKAGTVEELLSSLEAGEDCVGFERGFDGVKRSFAFHHLEGDKVAVRIAFGYAAEVCRGNKFVVGLLLPIPPALKSALGRAEKREEGFLMKDAKAVRAPTVNFSWEATPQR